MGQKSNLRPIERQREIGSGAVKKRSSIARFFRGVKKQFASGNQTPATATSGRRPNTVPAQSAPRAYEPTTATDVKRSAEPKLDLRSIGPEHKIGYRTDRIQSHRRTVVKKRGKIAIFFKTIRKQFAFSGIQNTFALRPLPRAYEPNTATHVEHSVGLKGQAAGKAGSRVTLFVSVCFGLLVLCGVIIALLFVQIKDMKFEMARRNQHLATLEAQVRKVEKNAQEQVKEFEDSRSCATPCPYHIE